MGKLEDFLFRKKPVSKERHEDSGSSENPTEYSVLSSTVHPNLSHSTSTPTESSFLHSTSADSEDWDLHLPTDVVPPAPVLPNRLQNVLSFTHQPTSILEVPVSDNLKAKTIESVTKENAFVNLSLSTPETTPTEITETSEVIITEDTNKNKKYTPPYLKEKGMKKEEYEFPLLLGMHPKVSSKASSSTTPPATKKKKRRGKGTVTTENVIQTTPFQIQDWIPQDISILPTTSITEKKYYLDRQPQNSSVTDREMNHESLAPEIDIFLHGTQSSVTLKQFLPTETNGTSSQLFSYITKELQSNMLSLGPEHPEIASF